MKKHVLVTIVILVAVIGLAACQGLKIPGITSAQASSSNNQSQSQQGQNRGFDLANMPLEGKLGIGILKLEGTPNAITPAEAQTLLPLWKALKSLSTSNTASQDEVTALEKQMEEALTPAQTQAIKDLNMNQTDMRALMQQYGASFGGGFGGTLTPAQQATRQAFRSQNGGNAAGGNRAGGGGFGGGNFAGGVPGGGFGGAGGQNGQPNAQRTPNPNANSARRAGGLNYVLADAVIKLLQSKAGA